MLNYSTAYLGQLFKNKTGEYFNTYLDRVRIQKAKELLGQGMKVYEAAERVGYTSVNYFHSKFKKYEGRSPSDFKNP
jgi:two-component system response regulator YesN